MTYNEIQRALSICTDASLESNKDDVAGALVLGFVNPGLALVAYNHLRDNLNGNELNISITNKKDKVDLTFNIEEQNVSFDVRNVKIYQDKFDAFRASFDRGDKIPFLLSYKPAYANHIVLTENTSPIIIGWRFR